MQVTEETTIMQMSPQRQAPVNFKLAGYVSGTEEQDHPFLPC